MDVRVVLFAAALVSAMSLSAFAAPSEVVTQGRAVAELVRTRNGAALEQRFTPEMAAAVPLAAIQKLLDETITPNSPLGARMKETSDASGAFAHYEAEHAWRQGQDLAIIIDFEKTAGKIAGLHLKTVPAGELAPDPHRDYRMTAHLRLPFEPGATWFVVWGGDTRAQNYHVDYPDQRHAYDILIKRDGSSHAGDGSRLSDYYAYGKRLLAPAAGTIVEAENGLPDNPIGVMDPNHATGNHVLLDLGHGEYLLMAHMQPGSVRVKAGDHLKAGQWIGLCGNSGNSSEPHLHIHVQDKPGVLKPGVYGLPATFYGYIDNGQPVAKGAPVRGDEIAAGP